ncbi:TonB family protein [Sphingomonas panacisoli]|uniref:TonB family protein n=2 Tax=Sphingomonas panacisoli TaxID=1813879 RepID=A0A5B8LLX7_9SPHN|nr:TonB family protein [Sphingomonas panacisoli]
MTLALAMTALPIVGLIITTQADKIAKILHPPITIIDITPPKDPPPDPQPQPRTPSSIKETTVVPPVLPTLPSENPIRTTTDPGPIAPILPIADPGPTVTPVTPPKPKIVDTIYDIRYTSALQPPYPAAEIRAGNVGRVVIRVLVGTDGRVKQVERVSAASDAFFAAAEKQALTKWRFKPATSDGTPIEQWKTMALRFELQEQ